MKQVFQYAMFEVVETWDFFYHNGRHANIGIRQKLISHRVGKGSTVERWGRTLLA